MFKALLLTKPEDGAPQAAETTVSEDDLPDGDVTVAVSHSTLNYKDGLALTGKAPVVRSYPMVPGIDFAGAVIESGHPDFSPGDRVILNGWGLGETRWGGYAQKARVKGDWLVPLPAAFSPEQAMAIGTAGYTAMLCVLRLEDAGVAPGSGPVLVTGASGGVGSVAVAVLARLGHEVVALTGRPEESDYLKGLGASEIMNRAEYLGDPKPLARERWAGVVDTVGAKVLANALAACRYGATVAACGLAGGMGLSTSVAPFILRNVTLAGVDSVYAPRALRRRAWDRLARDLDPAALQSMTEVIGLGDVMSAAGRIVEGKVRGRLVVRIDG
ncbi:MAG: alcohol dehydrogenase [Alphaproteobacteria bacterium]|nr:MAG: alcohol dehydrogenase [Alphaproteobacteria bacterium]